MRRGILVRLGAAALAIALPCLAAGDYRLVDAVKRRDVKEFTTLLAAHADVHAVLPDGATALAWAVFLDLSEMATKLIDAGAEVNSVGDYGETPLTLALANGNVALVDKLLKAGADPKAKRWNGETALMIAAGAGRPQEVAMLLDHGVDIDAAEPQKGQNALMWAAAEKHPEVVKMLLERGADVNATTKSGFTPLLFATVKNDPASIQLLLKAGADPNYALPDKTRVLSVAATYKNAAAAIALLEGGADPNFSDAGGYTPLHLAVQTGPVELVKKLLATGADLKARTPNAPGSDTDAAGVFFRAPSGEQTPLLMAAKANQVGVMRVLIEAGADPKDKAQDGTTLLLSAAASGHVEAAKYAYEFDKDVKAVDDFGFTAMHESVNRTGQAATERQVTELAQYLADIGVPIDEEDIRHRTAIQLGDLSSLDMPIQRMADILVSRGITPKHFPKEYIKPAAAP